MIVHRQIYGFSNPFTFLMCIVNKSNNKECFFMHWLLFYSIGYSSLYNDFGFVAIPSMWLLCPCHIFIFRYVLHSTHNELSRLLALDLSSPEQVLFLSVESGKQRLTPGYTAGHCRVCWWPFALLVDRAGVDVSLSSQTIQSYSKATGHAGTVSHICHSVLPFSLVHLLDSFHIRSCLWAPHTVTFVLS